MAAPTSPMQSAGCQKSNIAFRCEECAMSARAALFETILFSGDVGNAEIEVA